MKTTLFNDFKDRLLAGKLPTSFWVDCYPVTSDFFDTFNTDEYKVENFRTMDELVKTEPSRSWQFGYDQKCVRAEYCCEYITEPEFQYTTKTTEDGGVYTTVASQRYAYQSAQMCYRFEENPENSARKVDSAAIARGLVNYSPEEAKYFVHFFNHPDLPSGPNFDFGDGKKNDGTTLYMGFVPGKQELVNGLCNNGYYDGIFPIYGNAFQGFVLADTSGNLICYMDLETPKDFDGGCFVYQFPGTCTINNSAFSAKWATFASLE